MKTPAILRDAILLTIAIAFFCHAFAGDIPEKASCSRPILVAASPLGRSMIISPEGKVSGVTRELFDLIAKDTGCSFEYVVVPRIRAFLMLKQGDVDIVPDATRAPDREEGTYFVESGRVLPTLITLAKRKIEVESLPALIDSSLTLITIRGADYGPGYRALLANPKMRGRINEVVAPENAMKMLLLERVDVLLMSPIVIAEAWERLGAAVPLDVNEIDGLPELSFGNYMSRARLSQAEIDVLEQAILAVIRRGDVLKLLKAHYPAWVIDIRKPIVKLRK